MEESVPTVVTEIEGPGILTRFWMPHAAANQSFVVKITVDETTTIETNSNTFLDGLYGGQDGYIRSPLVQMLVGGQVSYEPIVFTQSLKIESNNFGDSYYPREHHYYQYNYHQLPSATGLIPYSGTLMPQQQTARNAVVGMINNVGQNPAGLSPTAVTLTHTAQSIAGSGSLTVADLTGSGRIRRLNVKMTNSTDTAFDGLRVRVKYDNRPEYAIDVPVAHFFGAGHERATYKSLPLGTDDEDGFYCYWPMPYHDAATVELYNSTGSPIAIDSAAVEYDPGPVPIEAGYLHAAYHEETTAPDQEYHLLLNASGQGHYVGNLLYVQRDGITNSDRAILEGDDVIIVDGTAVLHGTGLEDAYNGGYYYNHVLTQTGDGDGADPYSGTEVYHGLLRMNFDDMGDDIVRTDQYRWLIGDFVPFTDGIEVKIENYGKKPGTLFGATAFYYAVPIPGDADLSGSVNDDDLSLLLTNWHVGSTWATGDFDDDGTVDDDDLSYLLANWTGSPSGTPSPVPDPASVLFLSSGAAVLVFRRCGRGRFRSGDHLVVGPAPPSPSR